MFNFIKMLQAGFEPGSPGGAPPEDPGSDRSANCATATAQCYET